MNALADTAEFLTELCGGQARDPHPRASLWAQADIPRFASVLPYEQFDPQTGLYSLAGWQGGADAIGFCIECLPQVGVSSQLEDAIQNLPAMLPSGACMQVSMFASAEVSRQLGSYARLRPDMHGQGRAASVFRRLARRRYECLADLRGDLSPRDYRAAISVTTQGELGGPAEEEILAVRQAIETLLNSCGLPCWTLTPHELIGLIAPFLNPLAVSRRNYGYDPAELLADQFVLRDTSLQIDSSSIGIAGAGASHALAALAVSGYPQAMRLAGMGAVLGDPIRTQLGYLGPCIITLCARLLDEESARSLATVRAARASTNASSPMARLQPDYYRRQLDDWRLTNEVVAGGGGLVHMSHQVIVQAQPERLVAAVEAARSVWRTRGFSLASCEFMQVQGLLAALPMTLTPKFAGDLRRTGWLGRKTTHNVAHGLPLIAEWKGTRTPAMVMLGRRGQLMQLDIFESPGNYNVAVSGTSGTGKSVLLNEIATSYLGLGAQVWIIDIGGSYQRMCEMLGGQLVRFESESGLCINPFSAVVDIAEDMRLLKPLFAQMIGPQGISDYQRARLEQAITATWQEHGSAATPSHLRVQLEADARKTRDGRLQDMATMLAAYCKGGAYGRWFDGQATVSFSQQLCVLELEELKSMPDLQAVVLMQLIFLISQQMYSSRVQRKLVIIDEAWQLLRGEHTTEFIENGFRRARKYNGAFLTATQSVADFFSSAAARAAYANSDWMMLLGQKSEEVARLCADGQLVLGPGEQELLLSLRTEPNRFAEILVRCQGIGSGVGRLVIDPFSRLLFSTRAADYQAVESKRKEGLAVADAIEAVLQDRVQPYAAG